MGSGSSVISHPGACEGEGEYLDTAFPPDDSSLGNINRKCYKVVWKRAASVCLGGLFPDKSQTLCCDIVEGALTDCYVIAGASALATRPELVQALFELYDPHRGVAIVRLWEGDSLQSVAIDDFIPCYEEEVRDDNGGGDKDLPDKKYHPLFGHSRAGAAWLPLLEKALAKRCGSYAALSGGNVSEAFHDLTASFVIDYNITKHKGLEALYAEIQPRINSKYAIAGCAFVTKNQVLTGEAANASGVIENHAYSILDMDILKGTPSVLVRNPWGSSPISGRQETESQSAYDEGCSWVAWKHFIKIFNRLYFCVLPFSPEETSARISSGKDSHDLLPLCARGTWQRGDQSAAGASHNVGWRRNPMYRIKSRPINLEKNQVNALTCRLRVSVNLTDKRGSRVVTNGTLSKLSYPPIGMTVCTNDPTLDSLIYQSTYWNKRETAAEVALTDKHGIVHTEGDATTSWDVDVIVVPSTFFPGVEADFVLCAQAEWTVDGKTWHMLSTEALTVDPHTEWNSPRYPHMYTSLGVWDSQGASAAGPWPKRGTAVGRIGNNRRYSANNPCWRVRLADTSAPCVDVHFLVLVTYEGDNDSTLESKDDTPTSPGIADKEEFDMDEALAKLAKSPPKRLKMGCYVLTCEGLLQLANPDGEGTCDASSFLGSFTFTNTVTVHRKEVIPMRGISCSQPSAKPANGKGKKNLTYSEIILMPSTFDTGEVGKFSLSIHSSNALTVEAVPKASYQELSQLWPAIKLPNGEVEGGTMRGSKGTKKGNRNSSASGGSTHTLKKAQKDIQGLASMYADL